MTAEATAKTLAAGTLSLVSRIRLKGGRTGGTGAFSSDGSKVLAPRLNSWARIWNTRTGKLERSVEVPESAIGSSFSRCGRFHSLIIGSIVTVRRFGRRTTQVRMALDKLQRPDPSSFWFSVLKAGLGADGFFERGPSAALLEPGPGASQTSNAIISLERIAIKRLRKPGATAGLGSRGKSGSVKVAEIRSRPTACLSPVDLSAFMADGRIVLCRADILVCLDRDGRRLLWSLSLAAKATGLRTGEHGVACLLKDHSVVLVDPETGLLRSSVSCDPGTEALAATLGAGGETAAWACSDGRLTIWKAPGDHQQTSLVLPMKDPRLIQFISHDILVATNGLLTVALDIASGKTIWRGEGDFFGANPEGTRLVVRMPQPASPVAIVSLVSGCVVATETVNCRAALFRKDGGAVWLLSDEIGASRLSRLNPESGLAEDHVIVPWRPDEGAICELTETEQPFWPVVSFRRHRSISSIADVAFVPDHTIAFRGHKRPITDLLLLPDGRLAAWSGSLWLCDGTIRICDPATGAERGRAALANTGTRISDLVVLPDGGLASWSSGYNALYHGTIRIWDLATGAERAGLRGHGCLISGLMVLPDGDLASWAADKIAIWDVATGTERAVLRGHVGLVSGLVVLPDGDLASWADDKTIRIWDVATGTERAVLGGHEGRFSGLMVLPDGGLASWCEHGNIRIWDATTGTKRSVLQGHESPVHGLLVLPDGGLASWSDDTIRIWFSEKRVLAKTTAASVFSDGETLVRSQFRENNWKHVLNRPGDASPQTVLTAKGIAQMRWSSDGRCLLTVEPDGRIGVVREGKLVSGAQMTLPPGPSFRLIDRRRGVGAIVKATGETLLITPEGTIRPLPSSGRPEDQVTAFSSTGRYVSVQHSSGDLTLVESRSMQRAMTLSLGAEFELSQLAFSQDDAFLAALSSDGELLLFDLADGVLIGRAQRAPGGADAMFVSRDGSWVHLLQDDEVEAWHLGEWNEDASGAGKSVLRQNGIPASDKADLAAILGRDFDRALRDLEGGRAYRSFDIPKKSGGRRRIEAPRGPLHALQKELSMLIQSVHEPEPGSHGFVEGRSIVSNAGCHLGRRWVLNVDLKDFFPSVTEARVRGLFRAPPFDLGDEAAATLARLCCRNGGLPQGAPTSPVLANFAARQLDLELQAIASKYDLAVTRYADDITLSSDAERFPSEIALRLGGGATEILTIAGPVLEDAITRSGFAINTAKTRLQYRSERQVVTGLVVNERLSPMRGHIKLVRALIHAWESQGLAAAAEDYFTRHPARLGRGRAAHKIEDFRSTVYGHMSFLHMVRGKTDRQFIAFCRRLSRIDGKNPPVFIRETLQQEDMVTGITQ
jgi:RNA-directed DNA polymerase